MKIAPLCVPARCQLASESTPSCATDVATPGGDVWGGGGGWRGGGQIVIKMWDNFATLTAQQAKAPLQFNNLTIFLDFSAIF